MVTVYKSRQNSCQPPRLDDRLKIIYKGRMLNKRWINKAKEVQFNIPSANVILI